MKRLKKNNLRTLSNTQGNNDLCYNPLCDTPKWKDQVFPKGIAASKGSSCICVRKLFTPFPLQLRQTSSCSTQWKGHGQEILGDFEDENSRTSRLLTLWQIEISHRYSPRTIPTKEQRHRRHLLDELLHDFRFMIFSKVTTPPPQKKKRITVNSSTTKTEFLILQTFPAIKSKGFFVTMGGSSTFTFIRLKFNYIPSSSSSLYIWNQGSIVT